MNGLDSAHSYTFIATDFDHTTCQYCSLCDYFDQLFQFQSLASRTHLKILVVVAEQASSHAAVASSAEIGSFEHVDRCDEVSERLQNPRSPVITRSAACR